MAVATGNNYQAEHTNNSGKTTVYAQWSTAALPSASLATNDAMSVIETVSAVMRDPVSARTSRLCRYRVCMTKSGGVSTAQKIGLYIYGKAGIPASAPVVDSAYTPVSADAPFHLGTIIIPAASWDVHGDVITAEGSCAIDIYNFDSTPASSIYAFHVHLDSSHNYNGEVITTMLWFELN